MKAVEKLKRKMKIGDRERDYERNGYASSKIDRMRECGRQLKEELAMISRDV